MRLDAFDYELPPERIAQRPATPRDASRLLVFDRRSGACRHRRFTDLVEALRAGDLLVVNDTRVLPARIDARKPTGGAVELLLVEPADGLDGTAGEAVWRCLIDASRKPRSAWPVICDGGLEAMVESREGEASWRVRFATDSEGLRRHLATHGRLPLPPYIDSSTGIDHGDRYQTIYADSPGAVAAPTAGLHFTPAVFDALEGRGVRRARLTLHVGPGTFLPVRAESIEDHRMHGERYVLPQATVDAVHETRDRGGRVIAVGTTVVRVLEHCVGDDGRLAAGAGRSELFIYPGFAFRAIDGMLTNFHLPRSTLLMLVSAFGGRERVLQAYRDAVDREYRFYSYGDAMLLLDGE